MSRKGVTMEKNITTMKLQLRDLCEAMVHISDHVVVISEKLVVQEKKIDVILSKLLAMTSHDNDHTNEVRKGGSRDDEPPPSSKDAEESSSMKQSKDENEITKKEEASSSYGGGKQQTVDRTSQSSQRKNKSVIVTSPVESIMTSNLSSPSLTSINIIDITSESDCYETRTILSSKSSPALAIITSVDDLSNNDAARDSLIDSAAQRIDKPEGSKAADVGGKTTPPSTEKRDINQVQNLNHVQDKSDCEVIKEINTIGKPTNTTSVQELCNVTINVADCPREPGAVQDKNSMESTELISSQSGTKQASEVGSNIIGIDREKKLEAVLSKNMTLASYEIDESQRSRSTNEMQNCETAYSDIADTNADHKASDVKRQISNSSTGSGGIEITLGGDSDSEEIIENKIPELPEPEFQHRSITVKSTTFKHFYDLKEAIGGGRFGRVYRCVEKKSGLQLAAKCFQCKKPVAKSLLKAKSLKVAQKHNIKRTQQEPVEKEDVLIEISIMNHIDHPNIVKLYDAYENDTTMTLILEYLGGGELFERVLADQSQLTELDAVLFMRQIVTAVQYLHKNLILHLDLKPENILCLDRSAHHIKIIDFGLARKYNPRQKLMVQWGTPEFMSPEVLNYEVVSFPSDMWSIGVICYILLSGMSPFLGDDDGETMSNIVDCEWDFEEDPFKLVSDDAKDFISRLLVEEKRGRMSAAQCLRHEWLSAPLTSKRRKTLMNKTQLKNFMARIHWKASMAAVTAANWLFQKVNQFADDVTSSNTPV